MFSFLHSPDWGAEGAEWPHREESFFIDAGPQRWRALRFGVGPAVALIHGAGASAHSFSALANALSRDFEILAFDLPGHGFSGPHRSGAPTLRSMASRVSKLFETLGVRPRLAVGHSAGAAIMLHMIAKGMIAPTAAVSVNGALAPFGGAPGLVFPLIAKALYYNPLAAPAFSHGARDPRRVEKLIRQTGSRPPEESINQYAALMKRSGHVHGALGMMAHWDLSSMMSDIGGIDIPLLFLVGADDEAVPPSQSEEAAARAPKGRFQRVDGAGHLLHEEKPEETAAAIAAFHRTASEGADKGAA